MDNLVQFFAFYLDFLGSFGEFLGLIIRETLENYPFSPLFTASILGDALTNLGEVSV